jgi:hypothetical protein
MTVGISDEEGKTMPAMDTRDWRRAGYLPIGDAARAIGLRIQTLHHQINKGRIPFKLQGRYHFVKLGGIIRWIREHYTDEAIAAKHVAALREAIKLRHDVGAQRDR